MPDPSAPPPRPCPFEKRFPSQLVRDDVFYMSLAYNQAIDAWRQDEVPIGAIIEIGGEVFGAAHNTVEHANDPTAHAEILALRDAAAALGRWRLNDCTLVVTLEPCVMCAGAVINARVETLVYATADLKGGATASLYNVCSDPRLNHNPIVKHGVCAHEATVLLKEFFAQKRTSD
jgi:tRNA(adenine34) deaminase